MNVGGGRAQTYSFDNYFLCSVVVVLPIEAARTDINNSRTQYSTTSNNF